MGRVKQKRLHSSRRRTRLRATPLGRELHRTTLAKSRGPLPYVAAVDRDGRPQFISTKRPSVRIFGDNPMLTALRRAARERGDAIGDIKDRLTRAFRRQG